MKATLNAAVITTFLGAITFAASSPNQPMAKCLPPILELQASTVFEVTVPLTKWTDQFESQWMPLGASTTELNQETKSDHVAAVLFGELLKNQSLLDLNLSEPFTAKRTIGPKVVGSTVVAYALSTFIHFGVEAAMLTASLKPDQEVEIKNIPPFQHRNIEIRIHYSAKDQGYLKANFEILRIKNPDSGTTF